MTRITAMAAGPLAALALMACDNGGPTLPEDPPAQTVGERLFLETRFAQFFAAQGDGNVNHPLAAGDPAVATSLTAGDPLPGPFAGKSINCRQCHLVDELLDVAGGGVRTYSDFAKRSAVTDRGDGPALTVRNSPPLVDASLARARGLLLHFDGEFATTEDLVAATLTGRNFGWLASERDQAVAHIARVIREDDGSDLLAQENGGSFRRVLAGTAIALPAEVRLPPKFRLEVDAASDEQILAAISKLIAVYVDGLRFLRDPAGSHTGSPFEKFLELNALPTLPAPGESPEAFTERLRNGVEALAEPQLVPPDLFNRFLFHPDQPFAFGESELRGLRAFLARPSGQTPTETELAAGGIGNCAACHFAPDFTDFGFHNTGVSQAEYDEVHGAGAFAALPIPSLQQRAGAVAKATLPATRAHPDYESRARSIPRPDDPLRADLGAWSVFANADFPLSQSRLREGLCAGMLPLPPECAAVSDAELLDRSIATFKTPSLRDLGHSGPYFHDGRSLTLEDVVTFYRTVSEQARAGELRNPAPQLAGIALRDEDIGDLAAFLRSLNEDYE